MSYLRKAQEAYLSRMVYSDGNEEDFYVMLDNLEMDRRRQKTVVKEMLASGFILAEANKEKLALTTKLFNSISEAVPNLIAYWEKYRSNVRRYVRAVGWVTLNMEEQKYVLNNLDKYKFYMGHLYYYENGSQQKSGLVEFTPMSNENNYSLAKEKLQNKTDIYIYVSSQELIDHTKTFEKNHNIEEAIKHNLADGLKALGLVPKEMKDFVTVDDTPSLFAKNDNIRFSENPDKWEYDLNNTISNLIVKIANLSTKLLTANALQDTMKQYGGWDKFMIQYKEYIRTEYEKSKDTEQEVK